MKRGRHDAEYAKVRRDYRMANPEFFDPDDLQTSEMAAKLGAIAAGIGAPTEAEAAREAERKAVADARTIKATDQMIRAEWERYHIKPPEPLVSLALFRLLGWRVEQMVIMGEDGWWMIRPQEKPSLVDPRAGEGQQT